MVRPVNLEGEEFKGLRGKAAKFIENSKFINFIAGLIIVNAAMLGIETSAHVKAHYSHIIEYLDVTILTVFIVEILLKLFVYRLSFFRAGWNVFDFIIISGSLMPMGEAVTILRTLRIFRVLRLMSIVPSMRRVITAMLNSVPGMTSIIGVLFLIFYVSAVLATQIFGAHSDEGMQGMFGTIGRSMYTLFQIMTLEGWSENVAEPTMVFFPYAWTFFVPFIIITSFAVLNLFIGIIVDAMDIVKGLEEDDKEIKMAVKKEAKDLHKDIDLLRAEILEIKDLLKK